MAAADEPEQTHPPLTSRGHALIIGNSAYPAHDAVAPPVSDEERATEAACRTDAEAVAEFARQRCSLTTHEVLDATTADMLTAIEAWASRIEPKGLAMLYYSGRGVDDTGDLTMYGCETKAQAEEANCSSVAMSEVLTIVTETVGPSGATVVVLLDCSRRTGVGAGVLERGVASA